MSTSTQEQIVAGVEDSSNISKRRILNDYKAYRTISIEPGNEQIRLMQVLPAKSDDDEIVCALFDTPPRWEGLVYIALSYCWGSLDDQRAISLIHQYQDHDDEASAETAVENEPLPGQVKQLSVKPSQRQSFNVTLSLYSALKSIRKSIPRIKKDFPIVDYQPIWVDATCINQGDIAERNSQVGMMGSIYSKAWYIWIWLGEDEDTKEGLNLIDQMMRLAEERWHDAFDPLDPTEEQIFALFSTPYKLHEEIMGPEGCFQLLERLFSNSYFRRIWVLQEATIRAERTLVHTTAGHMPWAWLIIADRFREIWRRKFPNGQPGQLPLIWARLLQQRLCYTKKNSDRPLAPWLPDDLGFATPLYLLFLNTYESFDATDSRDKLFALLDLSVEAQGGKKTNSELKPDYSKSTTQVFTEFTLWCIHRHGSLEILSRLSDGPRRVLPDNPMVTDGNDVPVGCLDARQHPSWAIWPSTGEDWTVSSLSKLQRHRGDRYDTASGHKIQLFNLATHPIWQVPEAISGRLITLGGRRIGVVKSILRMPLRCSKRQDPGLTKQEWANKDLEAEMAKYDSSFGLFLTHPYKKHATLEGGLTALWHFIQKDETSALVIGDEIVEVRDQQWLGREGGRYAGRSEHMFRDFLETILLTHVTREEDADAAPDGDQIPDGPWDDPELATSFALCWAENAPRMEYMPPRIGEWLRKEISARGFPREKQFPFLFMGHGRCFFITENERMGMCSPDVNPGDIVTALHGSSVPFVLRPMDSAPVVPGEDWSFSGDDGFRKQLFRFMGDCYLHNRMSGSFFDSGPKADDLEVFSLC